MYVMRNVCTQFPVCFVSKSKNLILLLLGKEVKSAVWWAERVSLTSVDVVAAEVVPVKEHELDPVALVESRQADQQQQDGTQASRQLHHVHQLN